MRRRLNICPNEDPINVHFLYLSNTEINEIGLTIKEVISIVEEVFRELAYEQTENPPKIGVHPRSDAFLHAMPVHLSSLKASGLKWVNGFPSNRTDHPDLPTIMEVMILNDLNLGRSLTVMDCGWITATWIGH